MIKTLFYIFIAAWSPLYRSLLDKAIVPEGLAKVAYWAQLQTIIDFISAPISLGIATGITILIIRYPMKLHAIILRGGYILCVLVGILLSSITFILTWKWGGWNGLHFSGKNEILLTCLIGGLSFVIPFLSGYWIAKRNYLHIVKLILIAYLPVVFIILTKKFLNSGNLISSILFTHLFCLIVLNYFCYNFLFKYPKVSSLKSKFFIKKLIPFLVAGLSVGLLTPASIFFVRTLIAKEFSWDLVGMITAIWRLSDWILACAGGFLNVYMLPRMAQINDPKLFLKKFRQIFIGTISVSGILFIILYSYKSQIFSFLYVDSLNIPLTVLIIFWIAELFRIAAAIFVVGLHIYQSSNLIAICELLSQPLFAFVLYHLEKFSLLNISLNYLYCYIIYSLSCAICFYRCSQKKFISLNCIQISQ